MAHTTQRHDPDVCAGPLRRILQDRHEQLGKEGVAHVICAELDFVAFVR